MDILIAERNRPLAVMIEHQCLAMSYGVRLVDNGRDALLELQTKRYHMFITDILLPFYTGLEIIGHVNQAGWEYPRKRIILTLINNERTVFKAFHLGIDDYINKPLDLDFLMHRISKLLRHE